jgi:N6-adenosine-specific RNA methylase IME4
MIIKSAHQRRVRNPQAARQTLATKQRPREHFAQDTSIDATNASLAAYVLKNGVAHVGIMDSPVAYGRKVKNMNHNASPSIHYPTLSDEALLDFDFKQAFAKDAIIGMWTPASQIPLTLEMMKRNGFSYVTTIVWHKVLPSGKAANCATKGAVLPEHELLLIGRRGAGVPIPRAGKGATRVARIHGVIRALRGSHSQKPVLFQQELMRLFSTTKDGEPCKYLELFARIAVPGWSAWGNQAPKPKVKRACAKSPLKSVA